MESRIRPNVPTMAKTTKTTMTLDLGSWYTRVPLDLLDRADNIFSAMPMFFAKRPVCRNHLSAAKERSRKMVVTQEPAMKSGLRP